MSDKKKRRIERRPPQLFDTPAPLGGQTEWGHVLYEARAIVASYDTGVTLRQLFYRLVAAQLIANTMAKYKGLSRVTAEARRDGTFPDLTDRTRKIYVAGAYTSPGQALADAADSYRRDRTEGQPWSIYAGVEKAGMINQLTDWFDAYGVPVLALGGYASQSFVDEVARHARRRPRPAVLFYAGDHDPSGWDVDRDFVERTGCFDRVHRVALDPSLIAAYSLPESVDPETFEKLERDPRAAAFTERFGSLAQVELDALPPDVLRGLYDGAIFDDAVRDGGYWDTSAYAAVLAREADERAALTEFVDGWS